MKNILILSLIPIFSLVLTLQLAYAINIGGSLYSSQAINSQVSTLSTSQPNIPVVQDSYSSNKIMITPGAASGGSSGTCVTNNNCFNPSVMTILPGDTLTWINTDNVFHTVTSGKPTESQVGMLFDRSISPGNSISIIFNSPETINYFCKIHPWLVGQVIIGSGSPSSRIISQNVTNSQSGLDQTQSLGGILADQKSQTNFKADMRKLWEDHIIWTRGFITSNLAGLGDINAITNRLLQNQDDIGNALKPYYGNDTGNQFSNLLKIHTNITAEILKGTKEGKTSVSTAEKEWYANADQIAIFLAKVNPPNWHEQSTKDMLHQYLALTKQDVVERLDGNWTGDIMTFDEIHNQTLEMADDLSNGIIAQFPQEFTK